MRNGFDDLDLHQVIGEEAQSPAGVTGGWFRAGKLSNSCFNFTGDFDLASGRFAWLALKRAEWSDLAATLSQSFERASGHPCGFTDIGIFHGGTMRPFVR